MWLRFVINAIKWRSVSTARWVLDYERAEAKRGDAAV